MYNIEADIRGKENECLYGTECGGHYEIISEEYESKILIKASYGQVDNLFNNLKKESGEKTYDELLIENYKLKAQLEERDNLIEQYEEHNDARMEKYFNSDCIL